jgi:hypothetical protein
MTAAMTDSERALWVQAKADYTHALAIARDAWSGILDVDEPLPYDAIQAATATLIIHVTKLRGEERLHVRVPQHAATPAETKTAAQSVAVPPIPSACPKCGGKVWDNRENKKNPKAPDWKCRDKNCLDEKTGFTTGGWADKPKGKGANSKPVPAGSFDDLPPALQDDDSGDLPF